MMNLRSQSGMTLLEIMISVGILGIVFVGSGLKMKNVNERLNRVRASQSSDALQSYLRSAMAAEENVRYSVQFLPNVPLKRCLQANTGCRDGLEADFPVYLVGQKQNDPPLSGPSSRYTRDGEPCSGANCGPLTVSSRMRLFCSAGGSLRQACTRGRFLAIQYVIHDESRAVAGKPESGVLYRDAVEVDVRDANYVTNLNLSCPSGSIIRGIGLTGNALCTSTGSIAYADAKTMRPGDFEVKPKDCRPTEKKEETKMVKEKQTKTVTETVTAADGTTSEVTKEVEVEVEVEKTFEVDVPVADSDKRYVESISADGTINCADKTW